MNEKGRRRVLEPSVAASRIWTPGLLAEVVRASLQAPVATIVDRVIEAVDAFAGSAPQFDDITLLVLRRNG